MASIAQPLLFSWKDIDDSGDLAKLALVLESLPDENLVALLELRRSKGRNDYPVRACWNAMIAGIVYQHPSTESLLRELQRNPSLRELCGFNPLLGVAAVPSSSAFCRFVRSLIEHRHMVDAIFRNLLEQLKALLPKFGQELAIDSKAISSLARGPSKSTKSCRRGERDAKWGKKTYRNTTNEGKHWEKTVSWFGYKLHLVVDSTYELPVAYQVTTAEKHDAPIAHSMLEALDASDPLLLKRCEYLSADKAYDDTKLLVKLEDRFDICPLIPVRRGKVQETQVLQGKGQVSNATYDHFGRVYCHCPLTGTEHQMVYSNYERDRRQIRYRCPAKEHGVTCKGFAVCSIAPGIRIKIQEERRLFTRLPRHTYKWKRLYRKRSAVERVNSRIGEAFNLDRSLSRGKAKLELRCGLCVSVMLALAVGHLQQGEEHLMRSLVRIA